MSLKSLSIVAAATLALCAGAAQAVELTTNGGFETGTLAGWTQFPTAAGQQTASGSNPYAGSFAGAINNGVPMTNSLFKQANIGIGIVQPGMEIKISFAARGRYAEPGGVAFAEFFSELSGGGVSKGQILGNAPLALDSNPEVWKLFNFTTTAGPDVSGGVTLQLGATNGPAGGTMMWYDNASVSVQAIPEPSTYALMLAGLAGVGLLAKRRRQA